MTKPPALTLEGFVEVIGQSKLEELREAARPPKQSPLWMGRYCDDEQLAELYYRMFHKNDSLSEIARVARDIWGIQPHWQLDTFLKGLKAWRKKLSNEMTEYIDANSDTKEGLKQARKKKYQFQALTAKVDALGRLGYAIELQTARLLMGHEVEKRGKVPMKFVDTIQANLNEMIKTYVSLAVRTGMIDAAPSEVNINFQARSELVLSQYVSNDGNKMIRSADKLLKALESKCVKMELEPDSGRYKLVED